ncbi:MAG: hypothetical protein PHH83_04880 [Patescibacteria group bacterium]|nr:hypothetical protein [Patescibacteria group bacterium]
MKNSSKEMYALAIHHSNGLVPAWKQTMRFAGPGGRIATVPDIINARMSQDLGSIAWERYVTTLTGEYLGISRGGNKIIIVAHGIGPMATLDGICQTYSYEYKDKEGIKRGGRISREDFLRLESGYFGSVEIVDFKSVIGISEYIFYTFMTLKQAMINPLTKARLGNRCEEYLEKLEKLAQEFSIERNHVNVLEPPIIRIDGASNCSYDFMELKDDEALAHLITIEQPNNYSLSKNDYPNAPRSNLAHKISCHEWSNSVRFVGIKTGHDLRDIHGEIGDITELIFNNWQSLMKPLSKPMNVGFRRIMKIKNTWFTQYLKRGDGMDLGEPEFLITSIEKVDKPKEFITVIRGYHAFFKYNIKEVMAIAPMQANAYEIIGHPEIVYKDGNPEYDRATIQFYKIEVDSSKRLVRERELCNDFETLMRLVSK